MFNSTLVCNVAQRSQSPYEEFQPLPQLPLPWESQQFPRFLWEPPPLAQDRPHLSKRAHPKPEGSA